MRKPRRPDVHRRIVQVVEIMDVRIADSLRAVRDRAARRSDSDLVGSGWFRGTGRASPWRRPSWPAPTRSPLRSSPGMLRVESTRCWPPRGPCLDEVKTNVRASSLSLSAIARVLALATNGVRDRPS